MEFHPEIEKIAQEFQDKISRARAEKPLSPEEEKALLRQLVGEKLQLQAPPPPPPSTQSIPSTATSSTTTQQDENQYQQAIEFLLEITFTKGLMEGIKEARKTGNPYLIDEYHDTLVDRFYQEIKAREK